MSLTASDILRNADAFRRAYPNWPSAGPGRTAVLSALVAGRIATRYAAQLLTAAEAAALLQRAGCTEQEAWDRLAEWQQPVTSFTDPDTDWLLERADYDAGEG